MKLLVLAILGYGAAASASPLASDGFGAFGSRVGGRLGSNIGLGFGSVLDTVPRVFGIGRRPEPVPVITRPVRPVRPSTRRPGYSRVRDDDDHDREYERRSSSSGGRGYERHGSGGEYTKGRDYSREDTAARRERNQVYDSGRGRHSSERSGGGSRPDTYRRERATHYLEHDDDYIPNDGYMIHEKI